MNGNRLVSLRYVQPAKASPFRWREKEDGFSPYNKLRSPLLCYSGSNGSFWVVLAVFRYADFSPLFCFFASFTSWTFRNRFRPYYKKKNQTLRSLGLSGLGSTIFDVTLELSFKNCYSGCPNKFWTGILGKSIKMSWKTEKFVKVCSYSS